MAKMIFDHPVLDYFSEISQIPRGSHNEKAISDWMFNWAEERGLEVMQDAAWNILIRKPASPGYENAPILCLQGHLDMVCEKNSDSDHDFEKDPIEFIVEGDYLHANGTTLGADDGIGLAYILSILDDDSIKHPALECLMTTCEEVGMLGLKAMDRELFQMKSKCMINLDGGFDGVFFAGCAGGGTTVMHLPIKWEAIPETRFWHITVDGLLGGHSGADVHRMRANANLLLGRILNDISGNIRLAALNGGSKDNAIPRFAECYAACFQEEELKESIAKWQTTLRNEYRETDPDITISCTPVGTCTRVYSKTTEAKIIQILNLTPSGIFKRNLSMDKVVTSASLGVVQSDENELRFITSCRSSVDSEMYTYLVPKFEMLSELVGATLTKEGFYGGWEYNPDSRIGKLACESYRTVAGREPQITMLHAGLECGLLMDVLGPVDCIAMDPEINNCHGPRENCNIKSVKLYFELLKDMLSHLN